MKTITCEPTCAERYLVKLTAPVSFAGDVMESGCVVELSDAQASEIILHGRGVVVDSVDPKHSGHAFINRVGRIKVYGASIVDPCVVMAWPDGSNAPVRRKPWRPSRIGINRLSPRGFIRLDAGASIVEQVNRIVGR